jgi:hypothetical protein
MLKKSPDGEEQVCSPKKISIRVFSHLLAYAVSRDGFWQDARMEIATS